MKQVKFNEKELFNLRKALSSEIWKEENVEKPDNKRIAYLYKLLFKVQEIK